MTTPMTHILLVFGPGHGRTVTLGKPEREIFWMEDRQMPLHFSEVAWHQAIDRSNIHRYFRLEELSNDNFEEVTIYTHDDRCCARRWDERQVESRVRRSAFYGYNPI